MRDATETFKKDRDEMDIMSQQARKDRHVNPLADVELEGSTEDDEMEVDEESLDSDGEGEKGDEECQLSESECYEILTKYFLFLLFSTHSLFISYDSL